MVFALIGCATAEEAVQDAEQAVEGAREGGTFSMYINEPQFIDP
jgi:hypothetical protein